MCKKLTLRTDKKIIKMVKIIIKMEKITMIKKIIIMQAMPTGLMMT